VKPALTALVLAALFAGVVFIGGRLFGVWEEVRQPHVSAPPRVPASETTSLGDEAVESDVSAQSGESGGRARPKKAKARWVREANALCTSAARDARLLERKYENASGPDEVLALGEATLQGERHFLDRLAGLKRPTVERRLIRQMLALYEAHHRFFRRTVSALRRRDVPAAFRAGLRAQELIADAEDMLAFQLGAWKCKVGENRQGKGSTLGVLSAGS
jgi:hypothetical protein